MQSPAQGAHLGLLAQLDQEAQGLLHHASRRSDPGELFGPLNERLIEDDIGSHGLPHWDWCV